MQFVMKNKGLWLFAGLLPLWAVFLFACGGNPGVMHSMIASETSHIQVWRLDLGVDTLVSDTSAGISELMKRFSSEFANEQYYRDFLGTINAKLGSYGHQMTTGIATEGTILIKPSAKKWYGGTTSSPFDQRLIGWNRLEQKDASTDNYQSAGPGYEPWPVKYVDTKIKQNDAVRNVYIEITDMDGRLLGTIEIFGKKVKPEFVAEVIDRLIREGKW